MSSLKEYLREVRDAAAEHLDARHGEDAPAVMQHLPREEALATIALVTIRLLERHLQEHSAQGRECSELQAQLKQCRKALRLHTPHGSASAEHAAVVSSAAKRRRAEEDDSRGVAASSSTSTAAPRAPSKEAVELGQYSSTDAFGQDEQKRLKFARLMGGAKAAETGSALAAHHNTHAKNSAEVRRMNENLESQFESAMSHKGKKGLGA